MKRFALAALFVAAAVPPSAQAFSCNPWNPANPQCWLRGNAFTITGSGTISPGLTVVPAPQAISFDGEALVVGTDGILATYSCSFTGNDVAGSIAEGVGTVSGSCGPMSLPNCNFVRVIGTVVVVCAAPFAVATCAFTPSDLNPTTRYDLICEGVG